MGARLHSWWQKIKTHPVATVLIALVVALVVLVILGGYKFHWDWTGFNGSIKSGKTLWDWMQLLFIPVVLAIAGFWFNHRERKAAELRAENDRKVEELRADAEREIEQQRAKAEQEIASDNQREASLQAYINEISELLLHENLRKSGEDAEVRKIARVRTLTVLPRLDSKRKGSVLQFLYESGLIDKEPPIVDLHDADLSNTDLSNTDLRGAKLHQVNLFDSNLMYANLSNADLGEAYLTGAKMIFANLSGSNLSGAYLSNALLGDATLGESTSIALDQQEAEFHGVSVGEAYFLATNLSGADLSGADLSGDSRKSSEAA